MKGRAVAAGFDDRPLHVLDAASGEDITTLRGIRGLWTFGTESFAVAFGVAGVAFLDQVDWRRRWAAAVEGFAVLDVAMSDAAVAISVVADFDAGPSSVYCFGLNGTLLWRVLADRESNFPTLGRDPVDGTWLALMRNVNKLAPDTLVRWSDEGTVQATYELGLVGESIVTSDGRWLVSADGTVRDARTGTRAFLIGT